MRGWKVWAPLLLILVVGGLLVWSSERDDDTQLSDAQEAQIQAAVAAHNASFAPSRETLRAWALFDDVRCTLHVAGGSPSRVVLAATLDSGNWLLVHIDGQDVDYDSYRQGRERDQMKTESDIDDPERFLSTGAPCSVHDEGDVSSP